MAPLRALDVVAPVRRVCDNVRSTTPSRYRVPGSDSVVRPEDLELVSFAYLDHSATRPHQHAYSPLDGRGEEGINVFPFSGILVRSVVLMVEPNLVVVVTGVDEVDAERPPIVRHNAEGITEVRDRFDLQCRAVRQRLSPSLEVLP